MHREAKELNDPVWDCTLIKIMREKGSTVVNPIYHWSEKDVWEYLHINNIETNPLYQCGYRRVGCIGCPLASYHGRMKEFNDYPKYKNCYILAFDKMLGVRQEKGLMNKQEWKNGQDVFDWWIEEGKHNVKGQISMFEESEE